jgi:hypothetical protein
MISVLGGAEDGIVSRRLSSVESPVLSGVVEDSSCLAAVFSLCKELKEDQNENPN